MAPIPNLYHNWRVFKELVASEIVITNRKVAEAIFGVDTDAAVTFSKLI